MQSTTDTYKSLLAADAPLEWKINIDGVDYGMNAILSGTGTRDLMGDSEFGIGNVYVGELECSVIVSANTSIARMALVVPYCRLTDGDTTSEWLQKGKYYINTRALKGLVLNLSCYDPMLLGDQTFETEGEELSYPMTQVDAVARIAAAMGVTLDSRTVINTSYTIDYTNEMTMREVLAQIGVCHGGNWIITDTGTLRMVVLQDIDETASFDVGYSYQDGDFDDTIEIGRITLYYEDGTAVTSGEDDGTQLGYNCYWATEDMAEDVLERLQNAEYAGYTMEKACLDPAVEPGDMISVNGKKYHVCNMVFTMSGRYAPTMTAPYDCALESEYTYGNVGVANSIALGSSYEGVTITRSDGLTIERTDGTAKVVLNSREFTFYANNTKVLYFDPTNLQYKFVGDVTIDSGSININDKFVVDTYGNLTTSGNATLEGGTLTTEDDDTAISVSSDGLKLTGSNETLKAKLGFNSDASYEYPYLLLGAGTSGTDTSGLIKKFKDGLWLGNSTPVDNTGNFAASTGCNGIFFSFTDGVAYVVNGTSMVNLYTGDAIAKFG